jgi:WD40 repeat protein
MKVLRLALTFALAALMISAATANGPPPPTLLWSYGVVTYDIVVSKDGQYVATVDGPERTLRFYSRTAETPKNPLWTWGILTEDLLSVAISANGDYLAAGSSQRVYYWANARTRTLDTDPTWVSDDLDGPIMRRCLDISDDGNYVAAATGGIVVLTLYYWADARNRADGGQDYTWRLSEGVSFASLDMSSDGDTVAAGFVGEGSAGVAYVKNARSRVGELAWADWWSPLDGLVVDVAVSDDGNYVAAATFSLPATVYYWAAARSLSGEQYATWYGGEGLSFTSVDMSCDGDSVFAGAFGGVVFWGGARGLTGKPQDSSWTYSTTDNVWDVAINDAGTYMAAVNFPIPDTVFFFDGQGNLLWEDLDIGGDKLSMSCDGGTLAVGTPTFGTAYLLDTGYSDPCCGVGVGGVVATVDKSTLLAPYLALFVLIGGAGIASLFSAKKKRSD